MDGDRSHETACDGKSLVRSSRGLSDSMQFMVLLVVLISVLVVLAVGYIALADVAPWNDEQRSPEPTLDETTVESLVIEKVNQQRLAEGLDPVEHNPALTAVARNHSADMVNREYYAHENPEGEGPGDRVRHGGLDCEAVGENIAGTWYQKEVETNGGSKRHTNPEELADGVVDQWLNSLSHRNNMLDPRWEETGVGVVYTADREVIVTQKFCEVTR